MPRFALLYHECPPDYVRASHWDFMLEHEGVLRTWAVPRLPRSWRAAWERTAETAAECPAITEVDCVAAEPLGDHRLAYLHEEGALGGNHGVVRRIDAGEYEGGAGQRGEIVVALRGRLIQGRATLCAEKAPSWTLTAS
jgi:hypothetical protein